MNPRNEKTEIELGKWFEECGWTNMMLGKCSNLLKWIQVGKFCIMIYVFMFMYVCSCIYKLLCMFCW